MTAEIRERLDRGGAAVEARERVTEGECSSEAWRPWLAAAEALTGVVTEHAAETGSPGSMSPKDSGMKKG
ncbi:hypothetical protein ACFU5O_03935 [Streptomyces sp. NPDC057445]|uniref:hypothetical protein n=1 Tax=Streptomyces sp. NPDC057445 TaxID=3346136 RepID=UPI00367C95BA